MRREHGYKCALRTAHPLIVESVDLCFSSPTLYNERHCSLPLQLRHLSHTTSTEALKVLIIYQIATIIMLACVRMCMRACVRACVRECVSACVRACVRAFQRICTVENDSPEDVPSRATPRRMCRRERLPGGCTVENVSPLVCIRDQYP